jgi:aldehyde dehydrogenase (NAD+)
MPPVQRGQILHRLCNQIEARQDAIARVIALEAGKRPRDSSGEVAGAVQCGRFFAGEGQRLYGRTTTSGQAHKYASTVREPCGVAGLVIAANTPAPNFAWKVFPALICGNAVVLKAAEDTPASAQLLAAIAHEAGLPPGVLNVVHGLGPEAGQPLVEHEDVDVVSFTGSSRVGAALAALAGQRLKKISLELGGKNPFVVCADADLERAVQWACLSAYSNAGQRCAAGSRFIVFDEVYDEFLARFVAATRALRLGVDDDCDLGPVINARQLDAMLALVNRAVDGGARLHVGGRRATGPSLAGGYYLEPTVLSEVAPDAEISCTEVFGPVAAVYRVPDFDAALALANRSPYGLTACIHTRSFDRGIEFTRRVRAGVAVVNGGTFGSEPHMPFGGVGRSGNGTREPGTEALDVYSELKDIYLLTHPPAL